MAGGVPMNGPMQFPPGMQGRMMPAIVPPQMMLPGPGGVPAGWQGASMNNQPPNAGITNVGVAGSEGPAGMPSDPMLMKQMLMQQNGEMQRMNLEMHQMRMVLMQMKATMEFLQQENKKLSAEKSQNFKTSDPHKDILDLEQKKEILQTEVVNLMQNKAQLDYTCMQLNVQRMQSAAAMMVAILKTKISTVTILGH